MFEIRRVTRANAELLDNVAADVFDYEIDPGLLREYLTAADHLLVVAVTTEASSGISAGTVVGQAAAVIHRHPDQPTELYIDNLGVDPAMHRRGIATALLDELFELGRARGCREAWVGTEPDNQAANALYRHYAEREEMVMYAWRL